ncbi:MAG TPA: phosphate regulon sensor histidine kinase PhoR [Geobacteraceae bacterium]|nr:phosphate regulon sensor histidine kinase PhoR [Geobacteraceae bacterium]
MKLTMRWKLLGSHLLVALVMGGVLYGWLSSTLDKYMQEETRVGLLSEARLARLTSAREIRDMRRDAPGMSAAIARETRARVTFISLQGEVLGDSDIKPDELKELENHLNRPEVQQALKSGQGSSIRYSATLKTPMLYVAFPFRSAGGEGGVLRLALPLSALQQTRASLHAILGLSLAVALFISIILSYILSNVTSQSLRTMAKIVAQIGRGEFGRRVPVMSRDEVGELATVMNDMALRIEGELKSVAAEKNRLDTILRGMGEGVMVTDATGVITLVNPAFRTLFDLREEVEGKPLIDITRHPSLNDAFKKLVETKNERVEEFTLPLHGGKTVLTHWVPLLESGKLQGVVAVFHDISELKRLEKVRRDFVANVSHELRTPVTVIRGYAETLLGGALATDPERAGAFLEKIHRHAERLASLIGDLLILSELESGETSPELAPVVIEGVVGHVCALLEEKARSKKISIAMQGLGETQPVLADRGKLEQVMVNLLDNAIKYTPENGSITISAAEAEGMVNIAVTDSGIGIPPKELPRIFERFYRVDAARSREQGGTGLGLAIVKHIVQLHGGSVSVESTPGKGSTFSFTLKKV